MHVYNIVYMCIHLLVCICTDVTPVLQLYINQQVGGVPLQPLVPPTEMCVVSFHPRNLLLVSTLSPSMTSYIYIYI